MDLSPDGLTAIRQREGARPMMYRDSAGLPTIGVGHLLTKDELSSGKIQLASGAVDWHQGLPDSQIDELLRQDTTLAADTVNAAVEVPLTQNQFDCLCSFTFNVGVGAFAGSTLLKVLNLSQYDAVPTQLMRWVHSAGQYDPGLATRRQSEVTQWETP